LKKSCMPVVLSGQTLLTKSTLHVEACLKGVVLVHKDSA